MSYFDDQQSLIFKDIVKEMRKSRDARDRVDISLEKYEQMKAEISDLKMNKDRFENKLLVYSELFKKIGIPEEVIDGIDPGSVKVSKFANSLDHNTKYSIELVVNNTKLH